MALYSEKKRTGSRSDHSRFPQVEPALHEILVLVALTAKRDRVLEVKKHRVAAELEAVTGFPPMAVPMGGGGAAVFATRSWVGPDVLVSLLRARLEQESPNGSMFHFAEGEASDALLALEASRVARL